MNKIWLVTKASSFGFLGGEIPPLPPVNRRAEVQAAPRRPVRPQGIRDGNEAPVNIEGVEYHSADHYKCKSLPEAEEVANILLHNSPKEKFIIFESIGVCEVQLTPSIFKTWDENGEINVR